MSRLLTYIENRFNPLTPITTSHVVMVNDIDSWFRRVKAGGVDTFEDEPFTGEMMKLKGFTFEDPEGYTVEMVQYLTPYGV